jgi:hypothetical protein
LAFSLPWGDTTQQRPDTPDWDAIDSHAKQLRRQY